MQQSTKDFLAVPDTLIEQIKAGLCVIWCGAGLSVSCGLPDWKLLILRMVQTCVKNGLSESELKELNELQDSVYLDDVADFCRGFLGEPEYRELLRRLFEPANLSSALHQKLLEIPFSAILTTNYDKLIEHAVAHRNSKIPPVLTNRDVPTLWQRLARNEFFILKVHGDIERPETIVLSSKNYTEHVFGNLPLIQFLQRLLMAKSVLFIGTSFTEPYVLRLLEETRFLTAGIGLQHFALLPKAGPIRSRLLRDRYNVTVISYDPEEYGDGGHAMAIQKLCEKIMSCIVAEQCQ
jgi:SIR2-like domain